MSFDSFCQKIWTCVLLKIGEDKIWESNNVELLGVNIDKKLKSDEHILTKYPYEIIKICFFGKTRYSIQSVHRISWISILNITH